MYTDALETWWPTRAYGFRNGNALRWLFDRLRISFLISEGIHYAMRNICIYYYIRIYIFKQSSTPTMEWIEIRTIIWHWVIRNRVLCQCIILYYIATNTKYLYFIWSTIGTTSTVQGIYYNNILVMAVQFHFERILLFCLVQFYFIRFYYIYFFRLFILFVYTNYCLFNILDFNLSKNFVFHRWF